MDKSGGHCRGKLFRRVSSAGRAWGEAVTEKLVWHVVKEFAAKIGVAKLAPHDLRRVALGSAAGGGELEHFNSFLATCHSRPQNGTSVTPSGFIGGERQDRH
jgi:hypothetical protein